MDLVTLLSKRPHNQPAALSRDNRDNFLSSSQAKDVPVTNQFSIHRQPSLMDDWRSKPGGGKRGFNISSSIVSLKIGHQSSEQGGNRPSRAQIGVESCRAVVANNGFDVHSFVSSQSIRRRDNVPGQLIEPSKPFLLRGDLATTYSAIGATRFETLHSLFSAISRLPDKVTTLANTLRYSRDSPLLRVTWL